jgi:hypothetical protein
MQIVKVVIFEEKALKLSLENAWLPLFVDDYIGQTRIHAGLIITTDGQVMLAHKYMVPCHYRAKFIILECNDKMYIIEDWTKDGVVWSKDDGCFFVV